jgi:tetratricopeptide (TPR) repeat protein
LAVGELAARLTAKKGQTDFARSQLMKMLPKVENPKDLTPEQIRQLDLFASFFVDLQDYDEAEKIHRMLAEYDSARVYDLAEFLGRYRGADPCFDLLQEVYTPDDTFMVLRTALASARYNRDAIGDKYDALIQDWFDRSLRENPDYSPLLILQAELFDLQQRYEEAVAAYLKLLNNEDLEGRQRGIVLNNLSYMVSLLGDKVETDVDPMELVQEAVEIFGPTEAVLDTRAVVYISQQQYDKAIEDLELSVADAPTAVKYFHKALAHFGAGENSAALQAWDKAEELGLEPEVIDRMERQRYEETKAKVEQLRGKGTTVTDASRRAAG